jgi:hypothetical protein
MIYTVRIIKCENPDSWAADKIGLVFDALKIDHHNSLEDRMIFLGVKPEHGWIYEEEGKVLSATNGEMFVSKIDPPKLVRPISGVQI